jgi:hypothetical protein
MPDTPNDDYNPPDWETYAQPGQYLTSKGARAAKSAPPLTVYQRGLGRKLNAERKKKEANKLGAGSSGFTFQEWIKTPPNSRSPVGNLFPTPSKSKYGSKLYPTWFGSEDEKYGGRSHYWTTSVPLVLDRLARDIASGRATPKEVYNEYKGTSSIPYKVYGNPVDVPFFGPLRPVIDRGNQVSAIERLKKALENIDRKKNPPVQFTPRPGTKWQDLG